MASVSHEDHVLSRNSEHSKCFTSYDFDMRSGKSETGLKACTYKVDVRQSVVSQGTESVWIEQPDEGTNWRLVEFRPVSEGLCSLHSLFTVNLTLPS